MDADAWDERYAASELVWSAGPNRFVEAECADLAPGRVLDLAAGEGRNAIWLARRGSPARPSTSRRWRSTRAARSLATPTSSGCAPTRPPGPPTTATTWWWWPTSSSSRAERRAAVRNALRVPGDGRHPAGHRPRLQQPDRRDRQAPGRERPYAAEDVLDDLAVGGISTSSAPGASSARCQRRRGFGNCARFARAVGAAWLASPRDPDPAPGLRVRGPTRARSRPPRRAGGHRGGGVVARRPAAQRVRRPALHPCLVGAGVHPRRAPACEPRGRDPRPPGPDRARGQPGRRRTACCGSRRRTCSPSTPPG